MRKMLRAGRYPGSVSSPRMSLHGHQSAKTGPSDLHVAGNALKELALSQLGPSAFRAAAAIPYIAD